MRPLVLFPLTVIAAPAFAQEAPPPAAAPAPVDEEGEDITAERGEILVIATRFHGQVDTDQPPIVTLDEEAIAAYGAGSIEELISAISPQTGSGRGRGDGRPAFLLNGQRISSFRDIRDLPPEAIRRVEVLPEEVALKFGFPANQRVVNFILKDHFASKTVSGEYHVPTRGGFADSELEAGLLKIDGPRRLNLSAKYNATSILTEAERNLIQPAENVPTVAGDPDPAAFRSLIGRSRDLKLNGTWSTGLGKVSGGLLSLNAALTRSDTLSLSGLDTVELTAPGGAAALRSLPGALTNRTRTTTLQSGVTLNKPLGGGWLLFTTIDGTHSDTDTRVDRRADTRPLVSAAAAGTLAVTGPLPALADAGSDLAQSKELALTSEAGLQGSPFSLPAGEASLTARAGFAYTRSVNRDTRTALGDTRLKRGDLSGSVNLILPITSRKRGVLGGAGDITLNLNAGIDHLSDFGTLTDWTAGLSWSPTDKLGLQVSYIVNDAAPSLAQLGDPRILSLNVPVFDFTRGETALVTVIDGGNPDLLKERQRDLKVAANWQLPFLKNSNLIVEYFRNSSDEVTQSFPVLTPAIEAAFPDRVKRDANGQLIEIDRRPVTYSKFESSKLRWGFNISGDIGKPDPNARRNPGQGMGGPGGPRGPGMGGGPRGGGGRGFGGGPMGGGGDGRGRWNLSVYHTLKFSEQFTVVPGGATFDLLKGDAGSVVRNAVEFEGGTFYKGFGFRLNGSWKAPSHVRSSGSDLRFGSTFDVNARLFVNFDQRKHLVEKVPFLKGAQLSLEIDDIFESRQKVTDANGLVPLNYQAAYRDPKGRVIGLDFRKMF